MTEQYLSPYRFILTNNTMVTFDEFENELWALNPDGDIRKTYDAICFHIENYHDERDVPITYEKIKQRYTEYLS